ncbi:MAG: heavy metal response regulator transcription factor [Planctomycetes bacterium]|nr:heavy metal response regulator transcription factor [Planctomycetota bacterium]
MRILLVEDDDRINRFVAKGLREESHAVDVARNGEDGLHLATHEDYDLVILDLMLPKLDGVTVLERVREAGIEVPIIVLTARDAVTEKVRVLDAGADDYLTKPFSFSELAARIRAALRRSRGAVQNEIRIADLAIDPVARKVERAGRAIELTPKEFGLLFLLAQNEGHVLTRTAIAEHVWDRNFESFSNIIDVHVKRLRQKIDRDFEPKLLHTIRGVGYVLRAGS